ncbi:MAG: hypothetical protein FD165_2199 [Gammaproteobacteria bacterium]|nr:MAG: hypothetical protein FD165_2199 [Gammaproteobacteria bacterium]TND03277.1 MAG: hypothetical protein FD120_1950 [Gammaproteobacteria bacterium]
MDVISSLKLLALLLIANGAPVIIRYFLRERFSYPLDGGALFVDGRPMLGAAKTIRGVVGAVTMTAFAAPLIGISIQTGLMVGLLAMAGDIFSSFVKRRLGIAPSGRASVLDQAPESLVPTIALGHEFALGWQDEAFVVAGFLIIGMLLSRISGVFPVRRT